MPLFEKISTATAFVASALCVILLVAPEFIHFLFSVEGNGAAYFFGRRAGLLFLGLAVLCWVGRKAVHSPSRQAICLGLAVSMIALALLGMGEYLRGYAGPGIGLAIVTETIIGASFLKVWSFHKNIKN